MQRNATWEGFPFRIISKAGQVIFRGNRIGSKRKTVCEINIAMVLYAIRLGYLIISR